MLWGKKRSPALFGPGDSLFVAFRGQRGALHPLALGVIAKARAPTAPNTAGHPSPPCAGKCHRVTGEGRARHETEAPPPHSDPLIYL